MESEEKGVAETMCDQLRAKPIPCLFVLLKGRREGRTKTKFSPGRRERWGNDVYKIWIYFSFTFSV